MSYIIGEFNVCICPQNLIGSYINVHSVILVTGSNWKEDTKDVYVTSDESIAVHEISDVHAWEGC